MGKLQDFITNRDGKHLPLKPIVFKLIRWAREKKTATFCADQLNILPQGFNRLRHRLKIPGWKEVKKSGILEKTKEMLIILDEYVEEKPPEPEPEPTPEPEPERDLTKPELMLQEAMNEMALYEDDSVKKGPGRGNVKFYPDKQFREAVQHIIYARKKGLENLVRFADVIRYLEKTEQLKAKNEEIASDQEFFKKFTTLLEFHLEDMAIISDVSANPADFLCQLNEYYKGKRKTKNKLM
jgi:hypothetical protein